MADTFSVRPSRRPHVTLARAAVGSVLLSLASVVTADVLRSAKALPATAGWLEVSSVALALAAVLLAVGVVVAWAEGDR